MCIKKNTFKSFGIKQTFLLLIFLFFLLLFTQQYFHVIKHPKIDALGGDFVEAKCPEISLNTWFTGDFQLHASDYLNENFGFRNFFVRLNNQIKFSIFKKGVSKIVVGKNGHLYVSDYINAYYGKDFSGIQKITDTLMQLQALNNELRALGKTFLVVLAPNKARVYPEFIPENCRLPITENTNYHHIVTGLKKYGIDFIDFNEAFILKKKRSEHCLFPQLGIHWSRLEAVRSLDSMLSHLSFVMHTDLPRIIINKTITRDYLEFPDNDLEKVVNILFCPRYDKMGYPDITYAYENKVRKNCLVISDSYWADLYFRELPRNVFAANEFWQFGRSSWGNFYYGKRNAKERDIKRTFLQNDIIILVCSESNFADFGFGFIGAAASAIKKSITPTATEISDISDEIRYNQNWMKDIYTKASQNKISIDSMVLLDAIWSFHHHGPILKRISVSDIKQEIRNSPTWLSEIKVKAATKKISVDSMVTLDAIWCFDTQLSLYEKQRKKTSLAKQ